MSMAIDQDQVLGVHSAEAEALAKRHYGIALFNARVMARKGIDDLELQAGREASVAELEASIKNQGWVPDELVKDYVASVIHRHK